MGSGRPSTGGLLRTIWENAIYVWFLLQRKSPFAVSGNSPGLLGCVRVPQPPASQALSGGQGAPACRQQAVGQSMEGG